jgi:hypothetical protein
MLDLLQTVDIGLLMAVPDFQQRKRQLEWYAMASADRFEGAQGPVPSCAHGGAEE